MAGELIKVQFHGDTLDACGTCPEDAEVSIRRVCENLGVSTEGQLKKLKSKAWAVMNQKFMTGSDNKVYEVATITLKSLPMWLATIDPRKVKEQFREKLAKYQQECADVLANHFLRKPEPGASAHDLRDLVSKIVAESLTPFLSQIRAAAVPVHPMYAGPRATIRERLHWKNWPHASEADRRKVYKLACALLDANLLETPAQAGGPGGGGPLYFFGAQLSFLDEAIDRVREAKQRREREDGPHLFDDAA